MKRNRFVLATALVTFALCIVVVALFLARGVLPAPIERGAGFIAVLLYLSAGVVYADGYYPINQESPIWKRLAIFIVAVVLFEFARAFLEKETISLLLVLVLGAWWGIVVTRAWFRYKNASST